MQPSEMLDALRRLITGRKRAYQRVFEGPDGQQVLIDLARFCRAHESTFDPDARISATLDGRREVWLRIEQHLNLDSDTLWELYSERMKQ